MFTKDVVRSDEFLDLPATTQLLYFHFGMIADDDGIVASVDRELRYLGVGSKDDLKIMIDKGFIAVTSDGKLIFIIDWLRNNNLRNDRYNRTKFAEARSELEALGYEFKGDTFGVRNGIPNDTQENTSHATTSGKTNKTGGLEHGIPNDNQTAPSDIEKDIGLDIDKDLGLGIDIDIESDTEKEKPTSVDNDILFKNYMDLFINFAKKNINKRSLAQQTFIKLSELEKGQIITGAKNYINFYKSDRPDDESGQYSINAFEFLDNAVFKEYQTPISTDNNPYKYSTDVHDPKGWGKTKIDKSLNTDINYKGGWG